MPETSSGRASGSVPLISQRVLQQAQLSPAPEGGNRPAQRSEVVMARVISSTPQPTSERTSSPQPSDDSARSKDNTNDQQAERPLYQIKLRLDGRTVSVSSDRPLPDNAQVKLELVIENRPPNNSNNSSALTPNNRAPNNRAPANREPAKQEPGNEFIKQIRVVAIATDNGSPINALRTLAPQATLAPAADTEQLLQRLAALLKTTNTLTATKPDTPMLQQWLALRLPLSQAGAATANAAMSTSTTTSTTTTMSTASATTTASAMTNSALRAYLTQSGQTGVASHQGGAGSATPQDKLQQLLSRTDLPDSVRGVLQNYSNQLLSPDSPQGTRQQLHNSGLTFEHKLVSLISRIASAADPSTTNTSTTNTSTTDPSTRNTSTTSTTSASAGSASGAAGTTGKQTPDTSQNVFQQLWQQRQVAGEAARPGAARSVSEALTATRQKLENAFQSALSVATSSDKKSVTSTQQQALQTSLQQLLSSDFKAVLSRGLQLWLGQILAQQQSPSQNQQLPQHTPGQPPTGQHTSASQTSASQTSASANSSINSNTNSAQSVQGNALLNAVERAPEGLRLLQSALATLELEQMQRLQQSDQQWQLNIPLLVRHDGTLHEVRMQLMKEDASDPEAAERNKTTNWRVHLHFELQQLGPLDVEVNMAMPRVSATFWSETQSTLAALQPALQPLQQSLRAQGVEVDVLSARYGRLPERQHNQIQTSLVDLNV